MGLRAVRVSPALRARSSLAASGRDAPLQLPDLPVPGSGSLAGQGPGSRSHPAACPDAQGHLSHGGVGANARQLPGALLGCKHLGILADLAPFPAAGFLRGLLGSGPLELLGVLAGLGLPEQGQGRVTAPPPTRSVCFSPRLLLLPPSEPAGHGLSLWTTCV